VRFAAKLGFEIEPRTRAPIAASLALLDNVPPSRLFDEMVKLMQTGHALASVEQLRKYGMTGVFPLLHAVFGPQSALGDSDQRLIRFALEDTDRRVAEGRAVAPSFLLACLLWHEVAQRWEAARTHGAHTVPALQEAIDTVFDARIGDISGRGKLGTDMREIWMMQPRFERRSGNGPLSLVEQPRYRAGYDFLRLRADAGQADPELADWWEDFALGSDEEREALLAALREQRGPKRVRGPARAGAGSSVDDVGDAARADAPPAPAAEGSSTVGAGEGVGEGDAPRRRRRRRRKPRGEVGVNDRGDHDLAAG
jgi:poly(A) polymerase